MKIRKAEEKDIPRLLSLLWRVLQIHAEIRPDVFIPGTAKYTVCELTELLKQEDVAVISALPAIDVLTIHVVLDSRFGHTVLLSVV